MDIVRLTAKIAQVGMVTKELEELWKAASDPLLQTIHLEKEHFIQPPPNPKYYRLYGHYLCPFVERALLALAFKRVPYQFVAIDLPSRPKWYFDLPSKGKIPLLEFPNQAKYMAESTDICLFLDETFNTGIQLLPKDNEELKAKIKGFTNQASKLGSSFYSFQTDAGESDDKVKALREILEELNEMIKQNKNHPFFFDRPHPTFADILVLPHFRRILLCEHTKARKGWAKLKPYELAGLMWWYSNMMMLEEVLKVTTSKENFVELEKWQAETKQHSLPISLNKPPI
eukprot:TRINITY_DN371_c0_g1_i8.p1 TRINITY_DN371_c0_g1~~TRINITY_DN371_c0_g1_i8.p1  ORF type:complete len:286 (+),score=85.69 TRINITY_DN371_c0_g1_i8:179-1036(+)